MRPRLRPYLLVFAAGVAAIVFFSYRSYLAQERVLEDGLSSELQGIADLKAAQVAAWRTERFGDARVLIADTLLMPSVQAVLDGTATDGARQAVLAWTDAIRTNYRYDSIVLTDPRGRIRLSSGQLFGTTGFYEAVGAEALSADGLVFRDAGPHSTVVKPHFVLGATVHAAGGSVLGAIVMGIDPWGVLYPVTLRWPETSESGEVVLVRRDGNDALYLSEIKRQAGSAMTRREPLTSTASPAVRAVLEQRAYAHGVEQGGIRVLSAARAVPDSPWFVVAKVDQQEAFRPLTQNILVLVVVAGALVLTLGAGLGLVWRNQVSTFYRQQYETESERRALQGQFDEEIRISRERLALALEAADEGHWEWDPRQQTTFVSQRYHDMLGYGPGELQPGYRALRAMTHPDDAAALDRAFTALQTPGQDLGSVEVRLRCKPGDFIWVLTRAKVVSRNDDGTPARIVGTSADVTSRRTLEEQLRQAQKLESIGRLAGGVAHDFNNLLTVINGYSDLLITRLTPQAPLRGLAEQIRKAGVRAAGLTQQLLAFSRKQVTQPRPISLNTLVADSELMVSRLVGDDVELLIHTRAEHDRVTADPGQLHQVLMNLVVNARDAMPGGGQITVETAAVDWTPEDGSAGADAPAGRYVVLSVTDTGAGMDEETRGRIFEPFFTTKSAGQGTGLGLSTVYGIVTQSNGFLRVRSAPGQGTTIGVYLPGTDAELAPDVVRTRPWSLEGTETVLVVEDQHDVRGFVSRALQSYGYRVLEAAHAQDAIAVSESHADTIDLVITDIVMPGMNGRDLAERLKRGRPDVSVLYMSGYSDDVLGERGVIDAHVAYVQKPFSPEELAARVRTVLNRFEGRPMVLVVDDEEPIRALFQQLLAPLGCDVLLAADGREAIEIVEALGHLDLVVTDLVMPEQEGIETIVAIRRRHPDMKIVAMSGAFGGQFLDMARQLGADAIVTKPIDPNWFHEVVRGLIASRRGSAPTPRGAPTPS